MSQLIRSQKLEARGQNSGIMGYGRTPIKETSMKNHFLNQTVFVFVFAAIFSFAYSLQAALLVYEGFNYGTAGADRSGSDLLHGQPDGSGGDVDATGLSGTWQDSSGPGTSTDLFMASGSLSFGDLKTTGNHVRSDTNNNNDLFSRAITADLSSGNSLWFSVLADKLQNNFSAAEGGLVIGNQAVNNSRVLEDTGSTGLAGFGVAPTTTGNNWMAYAWDSTSQFTGGTPYVVPVDGSKTNLLVGKISWNTGTGGKDEYTLYYYDDTMLIQVVDDPAKLIQIGSTLEVDVDETLLDTLSLTRQVNTAWDEIRIADKRKNVLGIPEPSTIILTGLGLFGFCFRRRK